MFRKKTLGKLNEVIEQKDGKRLWDVLADCRDNGTDESFTPIFCKLLQENWHECNEEILSLLEDIKDPACIDVVYETALNIPDWDDGRGEAQKCIWVLDAIGTPEAIAKLELLAQCDDWIIRDKVKLIFDRKNNVPPKPLFLIKSVFQLEARSYIVAAGVIVTGEVKAGLYISSGEDRFLINSIEAVDGTTESNIGLTVKYNSQEEKDKILEHLKEGWVVEID